MIYTSRSWDFSQIPLFWTSKGSFNKVFIFLMNPLQGTGIRWNGVKANVDASCSMSMPAMANGRMFA